MDDIVRVSNVYIHSLKFFPLQRANFVAGQVQNPLLFVSIGMTIYCAVCILLLLNTIDEMFTSLICLCKAFA